MLQIDLFDQHLDVEILVLPEADGRVVEVSLVQLLNQVDGLLLRVEFIDFLDVFKTPRRILARDIDREIARLPEVVDEVLRLVELALGEGEAVSSILTGGTIISNG